MNEDTILNEQENPSETAEPPRRKPLLIIVFSIFVLLVVSFVIFPPLWAFFILLFRGSVGAW